MANAPTRPPNRTNLAGRPPRGPRRVPPKKRRDYHKTRKLITEAVEALKSEDPGELSLTKRQRLAAAVAYTLTPEYIASGRYQVVEKGAEKKNMAIATRRFVHRHLHQAASDAGTTLTAVASEALTELVAGRFTPSPPSITGWSGDRSDDDYAAANVNVRVDVALRSEADEYCKELSRELGWKVTAPSAALSYALHRFPLPKAVAGE